jgi:hypothetical protein
MTQNISISPNDIHYLSRLRDANLVVYKVVNNDVYLILKLLHQEIKVKN